MAIKQLTLVNSMAKSIQAIMPEEQDKKYFEKQLVRYLTDLREQYHESEEHQKNLLKDFLKNTVFPKNYINTSGRTDLAIFNSESSRSSVGVLFETKSTTNNAEMMTTDKINAKAFQEIIYYYLEERINKENLEIQKCIITNGLSWFVIKASEFEKHFLQNKKLVKNFELWNAKKLASSKTDFLYSAVISPAIENAIEKGIEIAHFDLRSALKETKSTRVELKANNVTQLYRFFTPENLLNKDIFTDSNKLNQQFYDELLYLMGLEEIKVDRKKVIQRLPEEKRQLGSFVENIIDRLKMNDVKEDHYETAVQLTVIWTNRILFLKLLESQLVSFNSNDKYKFLTKDLLPTFDDMYYLFFGVLAKKVNERTQEMQNKFSYIPYLNSSLFEESGLEVSSNGISIDRLREREILLYPQTVLKGKNNKKKSGNIDFLTYLFEFLDAYDFSTTIKFKEKSKNDLINASVLGLIFEKINGYKDGSFYTPGKITMYMSSEIVRQTVLTKINEIKKWDCNSLLEVQYRINSLELAKEINSIIDTVRICDPAVGSGHFIVSVLNEIIAIKSELGVLIDTEGNSLNRIQCKVVNDELIIQDFNGNNFVYKRNDKYSEVIQKAIFYEKRRIIENCLFGVDINLNSVNICRLRLWIELLKNSYYFLDEESKIEQLVTLPNIDINIKPGNSLLHNISLETDLDNKRKNVLNIQKYYELVSLYKETNNKNIKKELTTELSTIKSKLRTSFATPEYKTLKKLNIKFAKAGQINLFATEEEKKLQEAELRKLSIKVKSAEKELTAALSNPLFKDGLEWRMEFPEILDAEGDFLGFDLIIANPPYIYSQNNFFSEAEKRYFESNYPLSKYQANTFGLFLELGLKLVKQNGFVSMIIPNTFLTINQYEPIRKHLLQEYGELFILNSLDKIFEDAYVDNCIINVKKSTPTTVKLAELKSGEINLVNEVIPSELLKNPVINISAFKETSNPNIIGRILDKMISNSDPLEPNNAIVRDGLKVYQKGKGEPKQTSDDGEFKKLKAERKWFSNTKINEDYWSIIKGEHIERYILKEGTEYIQYGRHIAEARSPEMFKGERLLIRQIPKKNVYTLAATFTDKPIMHERSLIAILQLKVSPYYLLGILNSKIESYFAINKYDFLQRNLFPQLRLYQIKQLPIPQASKEEEEHLAGLVKDMLELNKVSGNEKIINQLNNQIDEFVMDLFNLDETEKKAVRSFSLDN
ncbi:DUF7149 domain-containing protein [Lysinibacillus fusiformis]|uniref:DUF7149 domain-containing protein n=1 Tax=Lysinibacillus fusiformis TaxID=28031 RepID=UPI0034E2533C